MAEQKEYLRFSVAQRFEHWVLVMSFTLLALTGLPQKFAGDGWAESLIGLLGGIETVRIIHHTAAAVLSLAVIYHIIAVSYKVFVLRVRWTMFPRLDDVFDALDAVRYNLGLTKEQPKLHRYGFAEKAEYWALVWGTVIMAITGFIMWNPINAAHFLPGDMIPTAKAAHGAEAILAVLAILIWHFYSVHVKTFNKAMFNGKLSEHQMQEEHGLELEQINQAKADVRPSPDVIKKRERIFIPVATLASVVMLVILYLFISYEGTALTTLPHRVSPVQVFVPITPTPVVSVTGSAASAIPMPADHVGRTTCLACHTTMTNPALPADHAGRTDAMCSACHKQGTAPAPGGTAAPTTGTSAAPGATAAPTKSTTAVPGGTAAPATRTAAAPAGTAAPTTGAAAGPKPQPADHVGRTTCNACHANGTGPAEPVDHAGRVDAICAACHVPSSAPAAAPQGTPASAAPTAAITTTRTVPTTAPASITTTVTITATSAAAGQPTVSATTALSGTTQPGAAAADSKEVCLSCHGPFDALITSSASFVMPSGETTSPHRYVPHDSKAANAVPQCTNCHTPHPIPPTGKIDVSKVGVDWCYGACHHQNNFTPCETCHKDIQ